MQCRGFESRSAFVSSFNARSTCITENVFSCESSRRWSWSLARDLQLLVVKDWRWTTGPNVKGRKSSSGQTNARAHSRSPALYILAAAATVGKWVTGRFPRQNEDDDKMTARVVKRCNVYTYNNFCNTTQSDQSPSRFFASPSRISWLDIMSGESPVGETSSNR